MNTEGKMTINQIKEKLKSKDYDFLNGKARNPTGFRRWDEWR